MIGNVTQTEGGCKQQTKKGVINHALGQSVLALLDEQHFAVFRQWPHFISH